ncbi:hypothetical protein F2P81_002871 [Scophthalmus maximus]|uniref:Uncharacterized protein n=1 Tax=Scophthalmus maximus TaxID=52904 RepID=A0A6A4TWC6_SCOMX|nr:hypothetical protein F2P81_002871 [Scophthalmus maximus]
MFPLDRERAFEERSFVLFVATETVSRYRLTTLPSGPRAVGSARSSSTSSSHERLTPLRTLCFRTSVYLTGQMSSCRRQAPGAVRASVLFQVSEHSPPFMFLHLVLEAARHPDCEECWLVPD